MYAISRENRRENYEYRIFEKGQNTDAHRSRTENVVVIMSGEIIS